jgi:hypothetical protein
VAHRHRHRAHLGGLRHQLLLDAREAPREAPLRRDLVLHRHHRDGGGAPHRQLARHPGASPSQELLGLRRRQDALVQWWYGHNAVAFFLTTPVLGIMYYFLPKAAGRPVYSYRLSIVHFWALVFVYIWAGPHHLLNTALPEWAQTLGMIFSLMLWAPSWGGMLNGLLTLRGAWDKVRVDPVLKFFAPASPSTAWPPSRGRSSRSSRSRPRPLHRLDRRPRALGRARVERLHGRRHVLLARAAPLRHQAPLEEAPPTRTSGSAPSASSSTSSRCGSAASPRASCGAPQPRRRAPVPELRRDAHRRFAHVLDAPRRRHHVLRRLPHDGVEPRHDREVRQEGRR